MFKLLLLLLFVPCIGMAGETVPTAAPTPSDEYASLQAKLAILKLKAEIAEQEAKIRAPSGSSAGLPAAAPSGLPGGFTGGLPNQAAVSGAAMQARSDSGFALREISSFDGRYKARIRANGHEMSVAEGDVIEGGWKVVSITDHEVVLSSGKKVIVLRA